MKREGEVGGGKNYSCVVKVRKNILTMTSEASEKRTVNVNYIYIYIHECDTSPHELNKVINTSLDRYAHTNMCIHVAYIHVETVTMSSLYNKKYTDTSSEMTNFPSLMYIYTSLYMTTRLHLNI